MNIYEWRMPEQELADYCTVTALVVETLRSIQHGKEATGVISMCDHIEGCPFDNRWQATILGPEKECSYHIEVKPVRSWAGDGFTCNSNINQAANKFIADKLVGLISRLADKEPAATIVEQADVFKGELEAYTGPCVCKKLQSASKQTPFPWRELTHERFPEHCFGCSCGENWWNYNFNEGLWAPVGDRHAWDELMHHNGIPLKPIAKHPQKHTLFLLETVRSEGFIPF